MPIQTDDNKYYDFEEENNGKDYYVYCINLFI